MTILEAPQAQEILADAILTEEQIADLAQRLEPFLTRYFPLFQRSEQRHHALRILQGKLSALSRKTAEPIAHAAGVRRENLQDFVGSSPWQDDPILATLRQHVTEVWYDPQGVFLGDGSGFAKKGDDSCGVKRQYCGHLGKVDNCQIGIFLGYACKYGHVLLDHRLFLPREWADDNDQREKGKVPQEVTYRETWEILLDQVDRCRDVAHAWFVCDSEFGKVYDFRAGLRQRGERYAVDVRSDMVIRDLQAPPPERRQALGRPPLAPFVPLTEWATQQPATAWQRFEIRGGEKGPLLVEAAQTLRAQTREEQRVGAEERVVVIRTVGAQEAKTWYVFSNAGAEVALAEVVWAHAQRHWEEVSFRESKSEVGMSHYEVRSWRGWHHHMTLTLLALWFLALEKQRLKKKRQG
jgi:SRSO17 transposase